MEEWRLQLVLSKIAWIPVFWGRIFGEPPNHAQILNKSRLNAQLEQPSFGTFSSS
jgi:hypothetical protein